MSAVVNPVRVWLRLEALAVFIASVLVWIALNGGGLRFALGFLIPDLALLAYLVGPRFGAGVYNLLHSYLVPAALAVVGVLTGCSAPAAPVPDPTATVAKECADAAANVVHAAPWQVQRRCTIERVGVTCGGLRRDEQLGVEESPQASVLRRRQVGH